MLLLLQYSCLAKSMVGAIASACRRQAGRCPASHHRKTSTTAAVPGIYVADISRESEKTSNSPYTTRIRAIAVECESRAAVEQPVCTLNIEHTLRMIRCTYPIGLEGKRQKKSIELSNATYGVQKLRKNSIQAGSTRSRI